MRVCKDGRIWGQNNKEAGNHLGVLTSRGKYVKKGYPKKWNIGRKRNPASIGKPFNKGCVPWNKGKSFLIGEKNPMWGKHHTNKTLKIMAEKRKIRIGNKSSNWQGGISFEPYTIDWTETLKRSIRERDHYICQLCNNYGNYIHHIDYDKKNCNPENLITLCCGCNSKVNFNREYWKNYFREKICLKN